MEHAKPAEPSDGAAPPGVTPPARPRVRRTTVAVVAVLSVVLGAASAYVYSVAQPKVYGAEAEFLLTPRPELSDTAVDRAMVTQVMLVQSPAVLQPVAVQTGVPLDELTDAVSAEIVGRSNILRITVANSDRTRALTIAQAVATAYPRAVPPAPPEEQVPIRSTVLTPAQAIDEPLAPQPRRALAAGALLGLLVAAVVVVLLWRPWRLIRPSPYWT